jgi:glycosyltransferase involved in cell wall biosynthesis
MKQAAAGAAGSATMPRVMVEKMVSVVVPARNEAALIGATVGAIAASIARFERVPVGELALARSRAEVLVVDNGSTDGTRAALGPLEALHGVRVISSARAGAPHARNEGARAAQGRVLVFVDADTLVPDGTIERVVGLCAAGAGAGITTLAARDGGARARAWWAFWSAVRRLPLPRAKAMPALMFCTREVFDAYGPFDEAVEVGEEWPILAGLYAREPGRFRYDTGLVALTSSRRMELRPFGYARTLARYAWAIAHASGRTGYGDSVRHAAPEQAPDPAHLRGREGSGVHALGRRPEPS